MMLEVACKSQKPAILFFKKRCCFQKLKHIFLSSFITFIQGFNEVLFKKIYVMKYQIGLTWFDFLYCFIDKIIIWIHHLDEAVCPSESLCRHFLVYKNRL